MAHAFVKNGVSQIALGDINEETAQETVDQLKAINKDVNAIAIHVDVANEDSVKAAIDTTTAAFGRIDFAVNNAGITGPLGLASDVSFEDWKKTIDINLSGVWLCQRAEITQMLLQEYPSPYIFHFLFFFLFFFFFLEKKSSYCHFYLWAYRDLDVLIGLFRPVNTVEQL